MLIRLAAFLGKKIVLPHWLHAIMIGALLYVGVNLTIRLSFLAVAIIAICLLPRLIVRILWFVHRRRNRSVINGKVVGESIPWQARMLKKWNKSRVYTLESLASMAVVIPILILMLVL